MGSGSASHLAALSDWALSAGSEEAETLLRICPAG
jgi:hypothetical protein